jgi:hypothetical protein
MLLVSLTVAAVICYVTGGWLLVGSAALALLAILAFFGTLFGALLTIDRWRA